MTFGDKIKERRAELGMTLLQLSEKVGVSEATIQRYESGRIKTPGMQRIRLIASILGVEASYLIGGNETTVVDSGDSNTHAQKMVSLSHTEQITIACLRNLPDAQRSAFRSLLLFVNDQNRDMAVMSERLRIATDLIKQEGLIRDLENCDDWIALDDSESNQDALDVSSIARAAADRAERGGYENGRTGS